MQAGGPGQYKDINEQEMIGIMVTWLLRNIELSKVLYYIERYYDIKPDSDYVYWKNIIDSI